MSKIKEITERIAAVEEQMRALTAEAEKREQPDLTAEENKKFAELRKQRDELRNSLATYEEIERMDMTAAKAKNEQRTTDTPSTKDMEVRALCQFLRGNALTAEERAALTMEGGGAVIPKNIHDDIVIGVQGASNILSHIDLTVSEAAGTLVYPVATSPITLEKIQVGTASSSNGEVTFVGIELTAYDYRTLPIPVSKTLLKAADADVYKAIVALFVEHISNALSKKIIVSGTDNKDFGSILSSATEVDGEASDSITLGDIVNLMSAVKAPFDDITRAKFLCSSATKKALLKLRDDNGYPIYARGVAEGAPATIFGYPVIVDDNMPGISTGSKSLAFGDFKTYKCRLVSGITVEVYNESKYADQGCIGMQGFLTGDGRPVRAAGSVEPIAVLVNA